MTLRLYAGWNFERLGNFVLSMRDSGGTVSFTLSDGTYSHVSMSTVIANSYSTFADALADTINASGTLDGAPDYTVAFSTDNLTYTIAHDTVDFSFRVGTNSVAMAILGVGSLPTASDVTYTSTVTTYYAMPGNAGGRTNDSGIFEERGFSSQVENMGTTVDEGIINGSHISENYGISLENAPELLNFDLSMEPKSRVFKAEAASDVPFTYEHFFEHTRAAEPFAMVDDLDSFVLYNTAKGAGFRPERIVDDWDGYWRVPFRTRVRSVDLDAPGAGDGGLELEGDPEFNP